MSEWFFEYEIQMNRPGLLGDITSLLGLLRVNIATINGVDQGCRGLLLYAENDAQIERFRHILSTMEMIHTTKFTKPQLRDILAIKHGKYIERDGDEPNTFRFVRDELGLLVDFMAELFKQEGHKLIGVRGMPRVGKTESIVAASVSANKRWIFLSSTMIKQTLRQQLTAAEYSASNVYILDGAVTRKSDDERHQRLVREIMRLPNVKVIEHPDIFVQQSEFSLRDFDCIIELRNEPGEEFSYELLDPGAAGRTGGMYGEFGGFNF